VFTARYELNLPIFKRPLHSLGFSRWAFNVGARVHIRPVHVRFVVDKVTLGLVFLRLLRFSLVSIIPPMLHTHINLHVALPPLTNMPSRRSESQPYIFLALVTTLPSVFSTRGQIIFSKTNAMYQFFEI
jgi:hypothetical protein